MKLRELLDHGKNAWRDRGKPRRYRTDPTCKGKRRFADEPGVRAAGVLSIIEEHVAIGRLWCYRCRHCGGFHLTSKEQGRRWEIRP